MIIKYTAQKQNGTTCGGEVTGKVEALLDKMFKNGYNEVSIITNEKIEVFYAETYAVGIDNKQRNKTKFDIAIEDAVARRSHKCWIYPLIGYALAIGGVLLAKKYPGLSMIVKILPLLFILGGLWRLMGAILDFRKLKTNKLLLPIAIGAIVNAPALVVAGVAIIGIWNPQVYKYFQ